MSIHNNEIDTDIKIDIDVPNMKVSCNCLCHKRRKIKKPVNEPIEISNHKKNKNTYRITKKK